jgi:hypothetical protein
MSAIPPHLAFGVCVCVCVCSIIVKAGVLEGALQIDSVQRKYFILVVLNVRETAAWGILSYKTRARYN